MKYPAIVLVKISGRMRSLIIESDVVDQFKETVEFNNLFTQ